MLYVYMTVQNSRIEDWVQATELWGSSSLSNKACKFSMFRYTLSGAQNRNFMLGSLAIFRYTPRPGAQGVALALNNNAAQLCSWCINVICLKCSAWRVLPYDYWWFLFTQVDLVLDTADLAGIVVHKWIPMYRIYFIQRFCLALPPDCCRPAQSSQASVNSRKVMWLCINKDKL